MTLTFLPWQMDTYGTQMVTEEWKGALQRQSPCKAHLTTIFQKGNGSQGPRKGMRRDSNASK